MLERNADWSADQQIKANDLIAIYNLGITGANAYNGDNVARVSILVADISSGTEETSINLAAAKQFPLESGATFSALNFMLFSLAICATVP